MLRPIRHAGTRPNPTPVTSVARAATASMRRSAEGASAIGSVVGTSAAAAGTATRARAMPMAPPRADSPRLSVSTCRARRRGRAPMATRTASSRCRCTARASSRLARFAHAMSSTHTDAPTSAISIRRDWRDTSSRNWITDAPVRSLASGNARARPPAITFSSARASASDTPGRSLAMACRNTFERSARSSGANVRGSHRSVSRRGKSKPRGITPTTT